MYVVVVAGAAVSCRTAYIFNGLARASDVRSTMILRYAFIESGRRAGI